MARTQQEFNQNEVRKLELTINDDDGQNFIPSAAYVQVVNNNGTPVVVEQSADIDVNQVSTVIDLATTGTVGKYKVIWRLRKSLYTYYHLTEIEVISI